MSPPSFGFRSFACACVVVAVARVGAIRAEQLAWELSGGATRSELDPVLDTDRWSLTAVHYFDPVDDTLGPHALASFLDPATQLSARVGHEKRTTHPLGPPPPTGPTELVTETQDYSIGGRYLLPKSRWYFGGDYEETDFDPPSLTVRDVDGDSYGALAGKYFGSTTSLELALRSTERRSVQDIQFCVITFCATVAEAEAEVDTDDVSLAVLHVRRFGSLTYSLSGRVAETSGKAVSRFPAIDLSQVSLPPIFGPPPMAVIPATTFELDTPDFMTYSIGGELFPTAKLGVRLGYTMWDDDGPADEAYDVAATWFFRRNIGLQFLLSRQRPDGDALVEDTDSAAIRAIGRL
jgi:hypothetical protein